MEPRKLRRGRADNWPAAVRHAVAVPVSGRPAGVAGLQTSRVVHEQRATGVPVRPPSRRTVQHEQQLPSTGADDLRQNRLAQGRHNGAGQDRAGQAQGVRVPQDPVPARVQAQNVPDRHVLQVPVDRQADEAVQVNHDTAHPDDGAAANPVAVLGPDARRRAVDHPGAHTRFPNRTDFRTGGGHSGHQSVDGAHFASGVGDRKDRWLDAVLQ